MVIIHSEGREHFRYREEECLVDVFCPMVTFTKGEDGFETVKCDHLFMEETSLYQESRLSIVIEMYHSDWPALSLKDPVTHGIYTVLTVSLEDRAAFSLPNRVFVDINSNPDVVEFLPPNKLVEGTGYRRQSDWVNYSMATLNPPTFYKLDPHVFSAVLNIRQSFRVTSLASTINQTKRIMKYQAGDTIFSSFYCMQNVRSEEECKATYDGMYSHFQEKWCVAVGKGTLGVAERFYLELLEDNRRILVERAVPMYDERRLRKRNSNSRNQAVREETLSV